MKPVPSAEMRADLGETMTGHGIPAQRVQEKLNRHMAGLRVIEAGKNDGYRMALAAMALVALLAVMEKLNVWLILFFCLPLLWGLIQAARGAVMLSSDVLRHMDDRTLAQLSWFQQVVVKLAKTYKGIA